MVDYAKRIRCARCDKNEAKELVEAGNAIICVCDDCLRDSDRVLKLVRSIPGGGIATDPA